MAPQAYSWTCSVCAYTWVVQSTGTDENLSRESALGIMGYPNCVNEQYGCMSSECVIDAFTTVGLEARQAWVTFDQAYAICELYTGVINPVGMYHYMAIRGVDGPYIWVANSAPGYCGVMDHLSREQFNALGPVQVIYVSGVV